MDRTTRTNPRQAPTQQAAVDQLQARLRRLEQQVETLMDNDIAQAERVIYSTYGDRVSVAEKAKNLNKFGSNRAVGNAYETIAEFQGTTANETFVTTNLIDSIVSDNSGDTSQTIVIEGHTIDGSGNLTFVVQEKVLTGTTEATLSTPLARASRAYVKNHGTFGSAPTALAGNVYIYDNTDGISSGVPVTAAATKIMILAGETQSEKCQTAISSEDYYLISYFSAEIGNAGALANYITVRIEIRDIPNGGAWRPLGRDIVLLPGANGRLLTFSPYLIVPKNHDVRVRAKTDTNSAEIHAELGGYLAIIT